MLLTVSSLATPVGKIINSEIAIARCSGFPEFKTIFRENLNKSVYPGKKPLVRPISGFFDSFSEQLLVEPRLESRVGFLVVVFYQLDLLRVVGSEARAEQIVLPLCDVVILSAALLNRRPDALPGLVGLVLSGDKAPVVAADLLKIEQRIGLIDRVVEYPVQPLGGEERSVCKLQLLDQIDVPT